MDEKNNRKNIYLTDKITQNGFAFISFIYTNISRALKSPANFRVFIGLYSSD